MFRASMANSQRIFASSASIGRSHSRYSDRSIEGAPRSRHEGPASDKSADFGASLLLPRLLIRLLTVATRPRYSAH